MQHMSTYISIIMQRWSCLDHAKMGLYTVAQRLALVTDINQSLWWRVQSSLLKVTMILYMPLFQRRQIHSEIALHNALLTLYTNTVRTYLVTIIVSSTVLKNDIIIPSVGRQGDRDMFINICRAVWLHMISQFINSFIQACMNFSSSHLANTSSICETKGCPTQHALFTQLIRPSMLEWVPLTFSEKHCHWTRTLPVWLHSWYLSVYVNVQQAISMVTTELSAPHHR